MKRFLILACAVATLAAGPALAQTLELSEKGVLLERVAAVVNDGVVLQSQVDGQVAMISERLTSQGAQLPPEQVLRQQILERLVLQEIQYQRAARLGIQVADEQLNAALRDVASRNNLPFDQLPAALAQQGVDYARYREDMRREITLQLLRQRDVLQRIYVSPRELEQYLAKQAGKADDNSEYDVSHILLLIPEAATAEQQAAVEQRARDLYERAQKGEDFGQLALTYSRAQTALDRGKLGWRKGAQLPQFIADLVANLQPGQVAEPVRTPTGFHIVRLNDKRGIGSQMMVEQIHARHILMLPNEIQDDATTRQKLAAIRERILKGEDFAAVASVTSEDPGSATQGGDLGWTGPGSFVPEFEAVLNDLKDNEISEPFRTQFGWHIVQSLGRRTYDQGDDVRRQRSLAALREGKADEETELWLRRLRDEAYIEYVSP